VNATSVANLCLTVKTLYCGVSEGCRWMSSDSDASSLVEAAEVLSSAVTGICRDKNEDLLMNKGGVDCRTGSDTDFALGQVRVMLLSPCDTLLVSFLSFLPPLYLISVPKVVFMTRWQPTLSKSSSKLCLSRRGLNDLQQRLKQCHLWLT